MTTRRKRRNGPTIQVDHAIFGPGEVAERNMTDSGPVLVVNFADGTVRSLLATPSFWLSLPDLAAIPVAKQKPAPVPESDDDRGDESVMEEDDALDLVIK
jgi:hypothetical protein